MQPDLQTKSMKISFSESVLHFSARENLSALLQGSFTIEQPTRLKDGRRPNKKIRTCLGLWNSFSDRKPRCTMNHYFPLINQFWQVVLTAVIKANVLLKRLNNNSIIMINVIMHLACMSIRSPGIYLPARELGRSIRRNTRYTELRKRRRRKNLWAV